MEVVYQPCIVFKDKVHDVYAKTEKNGRDVIVIDLSQKDLCWLQLNFSPEEAEKLIYLIQTELEELKANNERRKNGK